MRISRLVGYVSLFLVALIAVNGCAQNPQVASDRSTASPVTLTVSAATSLQDALEAIDPLFEQTHSTIQVSYNFGASGALQQQIEQGAPVDVFISAATQQMDALQDQGLIIQDTRRDLLKNQLVLIVPQTSQHTLTDVQQLTEADIGKIAVGEFRSVPAGQYAEEVFKNLEILEQLQPKFVFLNNVRGVLAAVESGNAEAGLVYATDAQLSDRVKPIAVVDESLHKPIVYPIAVLQNSQTIDAAKTYVQFLLEPSAQEVFQRFGFSSPAS